MRWVCEICGLVHEEDDPPSDCPVCGAGASQFIEFFGDEELTEEKNHSIRPKKLDDDDFYGEFE